MHTHESILFSGRSAPLLALALVVGVSCGATSGLDAGSDSGMAMDGGIGPDGGSNADAGRTIPAGFTRETLSVGGVARFVLIHVPPGLTVPAKAVVIVLHGGGGLGAEGISTLGNHPMSVFRTVADEERFVVMYPNGLNENWNDCRSDGVGSSADDVGFLDAVLDAAEAKFGVTSDRVFMAGGSNGGLMTFRYAFERTARLRAVSTGSANLPASPEAGRCTSGPDRALPILMTHGTADPLMPYDGGCLLAPVLPGCRGGTLRSAVATRDFWLARNGLAGTPPVETTINPNPSDPGPAHRAVYDGTVPVEWWRLEGAGHSSPSLVVQVDDGNAGPQNRDVEYARLTWDFFKRLLP
jgi:polyhydroxybutyrate depolymerase